MKRIHLLLCCFTLMVLSSGCSQRLSQPVSPEQIAFQTGQTTKDEVADVLGLPHNRSVEGEQEIWGYSESPAVSSVQTASVGPSNTIEVTTTHLEGEQKYVLIYVFDTEGVLIGSKDLRGEQ